MEWLFILGFVGWLIYQGSKGSGPTNPRRNAPPPSSGAYSEPQGRTQHPPEPKPPGQTYRPKVGSKRVLPKPKIAFGTPNNTTRPENLDPKSLEGLHDAFTGADLDISLGLYQCQKCLVFYHHESFQVLNEANSSRCVSCQSTNIVALDAQKGAAGRDYRPNVITLNDYKQHVGSVVTFRGKVSSVKESKRGNDFAVMFENKSWTSGFKLVFFRGSVTKVGGRRFINSLHGKTLEVRGLIVHHSRFGYEIIVSERLMILSIE